MTARRISRIGGRPARLVALTLLAGLGAVTALTACGAGQYAQTANQVPGVPGYNIDAGSILLRNVVIEYNSPTGYPAGGSAPLVVRIYNNGTKPVNLVSVASPAAGKVLLAGGATPTPSPSAAPSVSGSPAASGSPVATLTPTAAPGPAGQENFQIPIQPQSFTQLVPGQGQYLVLTGLKRAIVPGQNIPVTFLFSDGTTVEAPIPVDLPERPAERLTPATNETGAEG